MKPTTAVTVIVVVLLGAFLLYSRSPESPDQGAQSEQATVVESVAKDEELQVAPSQEQESIEISSFQGLDEEFSSILEGESRWQEDFMRLEGQNTATTAGN